MKPEIKKMWQAALLDPANVQGVGALEKADGKQCCLGVLCNLAVRAGVITKQQNECAIPSCTEEHATDWNFGAEHEEGVLPKEVIEWAGLTFYDPQVVLDAGTPRPLTTCNDVLLKSFAEIAELVEQL